MAAGAAPSPAVAAVGGRALRVDVGDVALHVEVAGEGRPVVLLHGFPDTGGLWRHQVAPLVEAGHTVVVPDLRGFGRSSAPEGTGAYAMHRLGGDVVAVLDALGLERVHLVGHDLGAALAWALGSWMPGRIDHLATFSVGHAAAYRAGGVEQMARSWYTFFFQFEGVAEQWLAADGWAALRDLLGHPEPDDVVARLSEPGRLTAALSWYRANIRPEGWVAPPLDLPPVQAPTLGVWSTGEVAMTEEQMITSGRHVAGPWRYERLEGCGHWIPLEAPEACTRLLLDFLPA